LGPKQTSLSDPAVSPNGAHRPIRVLSIVGTRPEVIKMAPVIRAIEARPSSFEHTLVTTGQHREMLDQVMGTFGLKPAIDLDLMEPDHRIGNFAARALHALTDLFADEAPEVVLIQGDTTTVLIAALAAFWLRVPLGHVEAGLRSHDREQPFPEELNREVAGLAARFHFAPTVRARENLIRQNVRPEHVFVTGNPIVDALEMLELDDLFSTPQLAEVASAPRRLVLVTTHRRENHGDPMISICRAIRALVEQFEDLQFVCPVHLNPRVQAVVRRELGEVPRVLLTDPLEYTDLLRLMSRAWLILTDSGGIQEEAPSFRKPVLVLREVTERPEAVEAGLAKVVGTDSTEIVDGVTRLLRDAEAYRSMTSGTNPFGDGRAGERIASVLEQELRSPRTASAPDGRAESLDVSR
jgi:UDP-N-acetylglucosamine 2-epimerase (non-hydrolysing)